VVKHVVSALACVATNLQIPDVALNHPEVRTALKLITEYIVEVRTMAGRVVIDADNCLTKAEQLLEEIGADEPRNSGDDPDFRGRPQMFT
jgi:hypothetical protein